MASENEKVVREAAEVLTALHYLLATSGVEDTPEGFSLRKARALYAAGLLRKEGEDVGFEPYPDGGIEESLGEFVGGLTGRVRDAINTLINGKGSK